jgi:hypothetical protein
LLTNFHKERIKLRSPGQLWQKEIEVEGLSCGDINNSFWSFWNWQKFICLILRFSNRRFVSLSLRERICLKLETWTSEWCPNDNNWSEKPPTLQRNLMKLEEGTWNTVILLFFVIDLSSSPRASFSVLCCRITSMTFLKFLKTFHCSLIIVDLCKNQDLRSSSEQIRGEIKHRQSNCESTTEILRLWNSEIDTFEQ